MTTSSRRILVSAYACEPGFGSEPGAGFCIAAAAAATGDELRLVTRLNNVEVTRAELSRLGLDKVTVEGFDLSARWRRAKKSLPFGTQLYYVGWQYSLRRTALRWHQEQPFDIVHHVTFAADWLPIGVAALDAPVVIGPVGGADDMPFGLLRFFGLGGAVQEIVRRAVAFTLWPLSSASFRRASLLVAQNDAAAQRLQRFGVPVVVEPNVNVNSLDPQNAPIRDRHLLVGVGRLTPWKGWALAVDVVALLPEQFRLEILGAGRDRRRINRRIKRRGLSKRVVLRGATTRAEVMDRLRVAGAMLNPSFHDGASFAVAEAITSGCPVVALDIAGPGTLLRRAGMAGVPPRGDYAVLLRDAVLDAVRVTDEHRGAVSSLLFSPDRFKTLLPKWYESAIKTWKASRD